MSGYLPGGIGGTCPRAWECHLGAKNVHGHEPFPSHRDDFTSCYLLGGCPPDSGPSTKQLPAMLWIGTHTWLLPCWLGFCLRFGLLDATYSLPALHCVAAWNRRSQVHFCATGFWSLAACSRSRRSNRRFLERSCVILTFRFQPISSVHPQNLELSSLPNKSSFR